MRATLLSLGAIALSLTVGCDRPEEAAPTDSGPIIRDVGFADTGAADTGTPTDTGAVDTGALDTGADAGAADVTAPDAPTADAPAADVPRDGGATDGGSCVGDGGCYACAPSTTAQFLNRCTGSACAPFNNAARLPLLRADGGLPPLP
jgi:hypothetical protein